MRDRLLPSFAALMLSLAASAAQALTVDAKALARFDHTYVACEKQIPAMKDHRDDAYLSVWRTRADDKSRAQLAGVRKSAAYQGERKRVQQAAAAGTTPPASSPVDQQCQALWVETQRAMQAKAKP